MQSRQVGQESQRANLVVTFFLLQSFDQGLEISFREYELMKSVDTHAPALILQQISSSRIHQPGSICLRHLGETLIPPPHPSDESY